MLRGDPIGQVSKAMSGSHMLPHSLTKAQKTKTQVGACITLGMKMKRVLLISLLVGLAPAQQPFGDVEEAIAPGWSVVKITGNLLADGGFELGESEPTPNW